MCKMLNFAIINDKRCTLTSANIQKIFFEHFGRIDPWSETDLVNFPLRKMLRNWLHMIQKLIQKYESFYLTLSVSSIREKKLKKKKFCSSFITQ